MKVTSSPPPIATMADLESYSTPGVLFIGIHRRGNSLFSKAIRWFRRSDAHHVSFILTRAHLQAVAMRGVFHERSLTGMLPLLVRTEIGGLARAAEAKPRPYPALLEAMQGRGVQVYRDLREVKEEVDIYAWDLRWPGADENRGGELEAIAFLYRQLGKPYNTPGIIGFIFKTKPSRAEQIQEAREDAGEWYCAELPQGLSVRLANVGLVPSAAAPLVPRMEPWQVAPDTLIGSRALQYCFTWDGAGRRTVIREQAVGLLPPSSHAAAAAL